MQEYRKVRELYLVWGRGVTEDSTYLTNIFFLITDKILLALKFELTHKYSDSKS